MKRVAFGFATVLATGVALTVLNCGNAAAALLSDRTVKRDIVSVRWDR